MAAMPVMPADWIDRMIGRALAACNPRPGPGDRRPIARCLGRETERPGPPRQSGYALPLNTDMVRQSDRPARKLSSMRSMIGA